VYGAVPMRPVIPLGLIFYLKRILFRLLYDCYNHSRTVASQLQHYFKD